MFDSFNVKPKYYYLKMIKTLFLLLKKFLYKHRKKLTILRGKESFESKPFNHNDMSLYFSYPHTTLLKIPSTYFRGKNGG